MSINLLIYLSFILVSTFIQFIDFSQPWIVANFCFLQIFVRDYYDVLEWTANSYDIS